MSIVFIVIHQEFVSPLYYGANLKLQIRNAYISLMKTEDRLKN
jgi:hypothetical protein